MKSAISFRSLLVLSGLFFSILICYGQEDPPDLPVGKWTKLFNERTVTFTIASDLKFQVEFIDDAEIDVWGSYVLSGTQIKFTDEGGAYSSDEAGVYEFQLSETSLTFKKVNDPVYGRSIMVEGRWSKTKEAE